MNAAEVPRPCHYVEERETGTWECMNDDCHGGHYLRRIQTDEDGDGPVRKARARDRIVVDGVDVTFFRGVHTPTPSYIVTNYSKAADTGDLNTLTRTLDGPLDVVTTRQVDAARAKLKRDVGDHQDLAMVEAMLGIDDAGRAEGVARGLWTVA